MKVTGIEHHNPSLGWIIAVEAFQPADLRRLISLVAKLGLPEMNCLKCGKRKGGFVHAIYAEPKKHFSYFYRPKMRSALIIWKHAEYTGQEIVSMLLSLIKPDWTWCSWFIRPTYLETYQRRKLGQFWFWLQGPALSITQPRADGRRLTTIFLRGLVSR